MSPRDRLLALLRPLPLTRDAAPLVDALRDRLASGGPFFEAHAARALADGGAATVPRDLQGDRALAAGGARPRGAGAARDRAAAAAADPRDRDASARRRAGQRQGRRGAHRRARGVRPRRHDGAAHREGRRAAAASRRAAARPRHHADRRPPRARPDRGRGAVAAGRLARRSAGPLRGARRRVGVGAGAGDGRSRGAPARRRLPPRRHRRRRRSRGGAGADRDDGPDEPPPGGSIVSALARDGHGRTTTPCRRAALRPSRRIGRRSSSRAATATSPSASWRWRASTASPCTRIASWSTCWPGSTSRKTFPARSTRWSPRSWLPLPRPPHAPSR